MGNQLQISKKGLIKLWNNKEDGQKTRIKFESCLDIFKQLYTKIFGVYDIIKETALHVKNKIKSIKYGI